MEAPEGEEPAGRRYLDTKDVPCDKKDDGDEKVKDLRLVKDDVGLGRFPSCWWTLNCKYNAAYDVQRLDAGRVGKDAVDENASGNAEERFIFARDNPDLVAFMLCLRTELHMRMVMPTVVRQTEWQRYMAMCRFEVGPGGNPHYHGFSVGEATPPMKHVRADVEGEGDEPPDMLVEEIQAVHRIFARVGAGETMSESSLRLRLCMELARDSERERRVLRLLGRKVGRVRGATVQAMRVYKWRVELLQLLSRSLWKKVAMRKATVTKARRKTTWNLIARRKMRRGHSMLRAGASMKCCGRSWRGVLLR